MRDTYHVVVLTGDCGSESHVELKSSATRAKVSLEGRSRSHGCSIVLSAGGLVTISSAFFEESEGINVTGTQCVPIDILIKKQPSIDESRIPRKLAAKFVSHIIC